jgi:hypothetical protein
LALLLASILALGACSGDSDAKDASATSTTGQAETTTPTSKATTATTEDPEAAVLAAYRAFWADVVAAGKTADWQSPRLTRHATGKVLARVRGQDLVLGGFEHAVEATQDHQGQDDPAVLGLLVVAA